MFPISVNSISNPVFYGYYPEAEYYYFDAVAQHAAREHAIAQARVQAIQRQRYRERPELPFHLSNRSYIESPHRRPTRSIEQLLYSVEREDERRLAILARQREVQRARAFAEAAAREEAAQRARARLQAQRAQQQQDMQRDALFVLLNLVSALEPLSSESAITHLEPITSQLASSRAPEPKPIDRKGKGKAVDLPAEAAVGSVPVQGPTLLKVPSFKEELEARIRTETDPEVQESLLLLYTDIFDSQQRQQRPAFVPVAGPSMTKQERLKIHIADPVVSSFQVPVEGPSSDIPATAPQLSNPTAPAQTSVPTQDPGLQRAPVVSPAVAAKLLKFYHARRARRLSLAQIAEVEEALRKLETAFEFPEHLEFVNFLSSESDSDSVTDDADSTLAYTSNNTPIHTYEHTLNQLMTKLDTVESNGDDEVRGRRREVVKEIERALEAVERRVEESRERERERRRERAQAAIDVSKDVKVQDAFVITPEVEVEDAAAIAGEDLAALEETTIIEHATSADELSITDEAPAVVAAPVADIKSNLLQDATLDHSDITSIDEPAHTAMNTELSLGDPTPSTSLNLSTAAEPEWDGESTSIQTTQNVPGSADEGEGLFFSEKRPLHVVLEEQPAQSVPVDDTSPSASFDGSLTQTAAAPHDSAFTLAPEGNSRVTSTATDATFATAESELVPPSASDDATFFTAGTMTPIPADPLTRTPSSQSSVGETFLLSSTPLADVSPKPKRLASDDGLEIISKDDFEVARNDSDWSDLESDA